jgi:hypothetical protein
LISACAGVFAPLMVGIELGFGFFARGGASANGRSDDGQVKVRIDPKARKRAKDRPRQLTSRRWGVSMERRIEEINRFTVGWTAYYRLADTPSPLRGARRVAQKTTVGALTQGILGIAGSWVLCYALPNAYWAGLGLQGFTGPYRRFRDAERTAGCGPARPVVWGAPG